MEKVKNQLFMLTLVFFSIVFIVGCGASEKADIGVENSKVKMAVLPYFDYTLYVAASELGIDKEVGLDIELVPFAGESQAVQALTNGSIDIAQGALGSLVPLLPKAEDLRVVLNNNQFTGFVYIGREGELESFDKIMEENGDDFEIAQELALKQLEGKTFSMVESQFGATLSTALKNVGLEYEDVKVNNYQDDAQAALTFLRGEGDLYTGSLPQQMKVLKEPGYMTVAGNEVLGDAGLWFSNTAVREEYLTDNKDIVEKVIALHYRMTKYLREKPEVVLEPMLDYLKRNASTDFSLEDGKQLIEEFIAFDTIEETKERIYNKDSPVYWRRAADLFVKENVSLGNIEEGSVNIDTVVKQEEIFNEILENQDLMDWINSPLE